MAQIGDISSLSRDTCYKKWEILVLILLFVDTVKWILAVVIFEMLMLL